LDEIRAFARGRHRIAAAIEFELALAHIGSAMISVEPPHSAGPLPHSNIFKVVANGKTATEVFSLDQVLDSCTALRRSDVVHLIRGLVDRIRP
jgi:hypothetical protein